MVLYLCDDYGVISALEVAASGTVIVWNDCLVLQCLWNGCKMFFGDLWNGVRCCGDLRNVFRCDSSCEFTVWTNCIDGYGAMIMWCRWSDHLVSVK